MHLEARVPDWDSYFMEIALIASTRSKDLKTKVGTCIVKNKKVLSIGYNGAPRGFPDKDVPDSCDESLPYIEQKYPYMCHSELNAILNFGGSLKELENSTLYTTVSPCYECAKAIIQVGISRIIYKEEYHKKDVWEMSKFLLSKCGVEFYRL